MTTTWKDPKVAAGVRDYIKKLVRREIDIQRPKPQHGTVQVLDLVGQVATVIFPDQSTVPVAVPSDTEISVGDRVRVAGTAGDRYIEGAGFVGGVVVNPPPVGYDPRTLDVGALVIRVATSNLLGPSAADEISQAHIVVDGTDDAAILNFTMTASMFWSPFSTLWFQMGSGFFRLKSSLQIPGGGTAIFSGRLPSHQTEGSAHTNFWIGPGFVDDDVVFQAGGPATNLTVHAANIVVEPGIEEDTKPFKLTDCNIVDMEDVSAGQTGVMTRAYKPTYTEGASRLLLRRTFLRGEAATPLISCALGADSAGTTFDELLLQDSIVDNAGGSALRFEAERFVLQNTVFGGVGTDYCVDMLFQSHATPPDRIQQMRGCKIKTQPASPGSSSPLPAPFLRMQNTVGVMVRDVTGTFENWSTDDSVYYPTFETLVLLDEGARNCDVSNNQFLVATGGDFGASGDGEYFPAKIELAAGSVRCAVSNAPQLLFDEGTGNDYPTYTYDFSSPGEFDSGPSGLYAATRTGYLFECVATLRVAGTTDTVFTVSVGDTIVGTFTIPAGENVVVLPIDHAIVGKYFMVSVNIATVGTGAEDFYVQVKEQ